MMCVEVTVVPQCRVGLAPTLLDGPPAGCQAATGIAVGGVVPWVAMAGFQARPVVMTACNWRRIAAAITAWAWVVVSLFWSRGGEVVESGGVDGVGALRAPDRTPGGESECGAALAGQFGAADEAAGQFL